MIKNVRFATQAEVDNMDKLKASGIVVRKIVPNDKDILSLIESVDLNIQYWKCKTVIDHKKVERLKGLRIRLLDMIS